MKLKSLLQDCTFTLVKGSLEQQVTSIVNNSRKAMLGSLFVCIKGYKADGHHFIEEAIKNGATSIIVEEEIPIHEDITVIKVQNTRKMLAFLSARFYMYPSYQFKLVGVTGTNGKTSTVFLISNILKTYGKKVGIVGTIQNEIDKQVLKTSRTTPESVELQQLFAMMRDALVQNVVMEVSSHALALHRADYCDFDVGVFTNLTLDHLDFHKTLLNYKNAKLKLFKKCRTGIINIDDPVGVYMLENGTCEEYITYGCDNVTADLNAYAINFAITGTSFKLRYKDKVIEFLLQTPGKFSVYNALAAIGAGLALQVPIETIKYSLEKHSQVKGRFQPIKSEKGYYAIVDYAHTPDGLLNVLKTILEFAKREIITVFGCGGDRDKSKRPQMGKIAGDYSTYCIITSDNPRTEEPHSIIEDIEVGIKMTTCQYDIIPDREEAIKSALERAKEGDIVLVAGKGHEDYQIVGKEKKHFDDAEIIKKYLK